MIKHTVTVTSRLSGGSSHSPAASATSTSSRREDRKRSRTEHHDPGISSSSKKAAESNVSKTEIKTESSVNTENDQQERSPSPQPGPSGLQQSVGGGLNAPDLQLDCLSSDTEEEEDVTVVKISRRRKGMAKNGGRLTINAPAGSVVEVDLTQESDHQDDDDDDDIHVDAIRTRSDGSNGGLKLRQFATAPHLPPNVQSRGSTPSTTPAPTVHVWPPTEIGASSSSSATAAAGVPGPSNADSYMEPHSHPCNGECATGMFHSHQPREEYRPRRLCQPYSGHHHRMACQDAHCRAHRVGPLSGMSYGNLPTDQPLDYRTTATTNTATSATTSSASTSAESPPNSQRLINAVWRMQHHPSMRSRLHPRHQRLWHDCQVQQELRRRHMGSASNPAPPAAAPPHPPPDYHLLPYHHHHHSGTSMYARMFANYYEGGIHRWHPHTNFPPPTDAGQRAMATAVGRAAGSMYPFLLQPVGAVPTNEAYMRAMEQRRAEANSRGASKSCIERNTFPHKFKPFSREKKEETDEKDEVDKCTICLCGKFPNSENSCSNFNFMTDF